MFWFFSYVVSLLRIHSGAWTGTRDVHFSKKAVVSFFPIWNGKKRTLLRFHCQCHVGGGVSVAEPNRSLITMHSYADEYIHALSTQVRNLTARLAVCQAITALSGGGDGKRLQGMRSGWQSRDAPTSVFAHVYGLKDSNNVVRKRKSSYRFLAPVRAENHWGKYIYPNPFLYGWWENPATQEPHMWNVSCNSILSTMHKHALLLATNSYVAHRVH